MQSQNRRILVTNDDGIDSPDLAALVAALGERWEVEVCAPDGNRSGVAHSVTMIYDPLEVRFREVPGASRACSVSGTPADAASFGIFHLGAERAFDLLVSGINRGSNVGRVAHMSGTIGAAMHGALMGLPSIAVSVEWEAGPEHAAVFSARFVEELFRRGTDPDVVYSINVPGGEPREVEFSPMGGSYFQLTEYRSFGNGGAGELFEARMEKDLPGPPGSDTAVYQSGVISVTPLRVDWTHRRALDEGASWEL